MMKLRVSMTFGILASAGFSTTALADTFVNPLDTVPKPNVEIGFDHSVTMGIEPNCGGCHGPGNPATRLNIAKQDIQTTLPLFKDYFLFGGFTYKGCGYAEVTSRYLPTPANPELSYNQVRSMINGLNHCGSRENNLPNGGSSWTNCITPTVGCSGDPAILNSIVNAGGIAGLGITPPAVLTSSTCGQPTSPVPTYSVQAAVLSKLAGGAFSWPRWDASSVNGSDVNTDLCNPLSTVLGQIRSEMSQCFVDPDAVWDLSFLDTGSWCDPGTIAGNVCSGSPLTGTCVCDQSDPGCINAGLVVSDCGIPFTWKARQQVAVCELYDSSAPNRFGTYYQNQSDNRVNPGGCRENVGMIFTDGYMGDTAGVAAEAAQALFYYRSVSGLSNLFIFRIADPFAGAADTMQTAVSDGVIPAAFLATDVDAMQASFAQVLSRVFKGVYSGTSIAMDTFQTRAYFNTFTVPGYSGSGPVTDTYIGWPQRISAYEVNPDGSLQSNPIFETDWASKAGAGPGCGPSYLNGSTRIGSIAGFPDRDKVGPGDRFRNGVPRAVSVAGNSIDRDGDGVTDAHPPLRWGYSYGFAGTRPLVVEFPRELPSGPNSTTFPMYQSSIQGRPRAIYTLTSGYLIGYHGGDYQASAGMYGNQKYAFTYDDSVGAAGTEILRYRPSWLNDSNADYRYDLNDLVMQPMLDGELEAREVYHNGSWKTVLVGSAGIDGRGYFVLDVTDPCDVSVIGEWTLPNASDRASNEPKIYYLPTASGPEPMLVLTSGYDDPSTAPPSANRIYAYTLDGTLQFSRTLMGPGNRSYAVTPICVDTRGEGSVTHCYVLRSDGLLNRVEVFQGSFGSELDITPNAPFSPIGGGRQYYTIPAVYFDSRQVPNIVYGSGDFRNLTAPSVQNYVFVARDEAVRKASIGSTRADVTTSCTPIGGSGPTDGVIPLAPGERMVSSPVIAGGGVYWTAYTSVSSGCISGSGSLYAMNYETCEDLLNPSNDRPSPVPVGDGIPMSPVLNRRANVVYTQTSAGPTADQVGVQNTEVRGGRQPYAKRLYWRLLMDIR